MEMTRKEILNSSEYWQEMAETQCYTEGIDCTIQLVDKQQLIDKVCEWIKEHDGDYISIVPNDHLTNKFYDDLRKAMKGE